jgi:hypothetical protein
MKREILETFYLKHLKDFQPVVENATEFFPILLQFISLLSQDDDDTKNQNANCRDWGNGILALDCIRICLRNKSNILPFLNREFIDQLLSFIDLTPTTTAEAKDDYVLSLINFSTASLRCLTNLLNMNHVAIDIFLSLNGLSWLLMKLQREGHITHLFYSVRLVYMLISQR